MKIREILKLFNKLEMETREGRDTIANFRYNGEVIVRTKVPHKRGELKGQLVHFIRQQLRLNESQFQKLADCTLYRKDYEQILKDKGYIDK
jgi:hypothetical protein